MHAEFLWINLMERTHLTDIGFGWKDSIKKYPKWVGWEELDLLDMETERKKVTGCC